MTAQPDKEELLKWAEAQLDANRIEQSKLNIERRKEGLQLGLIEAGQNQAQETRLLRGKVQELLEYLQRHALRDDAIQDFHKNISERFETIERGLMLVLMERLDSPQTQAEAQRVVDSLQTTLTSESKKRQLARWYNNLNRLEEKRAAGDDSIATLNKIDEAKNEITRLETEIND